MPRLSHAQSIARQRIADVALRGLQPQQFAERVCRELRCAVHFDGYRLFGLDPSTQLINRTVAASDDDGPARNEWLREVYLAQSPIRYSTFTALMSAGVSVSAFHDRQDTCWGIPKPLMEQVSARDHWSYYHASQTPVGGVLFAGFAAHSRWVALLQLYRRDENRPFQPTDVDFVRLIAPTIGQTLDAALTRERVRIESNTTSGASGFILLERDGRLRFSTPSAEAWSDLMRQAERPDDGPLPTAVWTSIASLQAGKPSSLLTPTSVGLVRVEASSGGPDGSIAVVLVPERPPALPEVPDEWRLTPQERQVVELLVQGLSNAEMATRLFSSERTIESHLDHVYDKLGVHSRNQVVARFFLHTYLPSLVLNP